MKQNAVYIIPVNPFLRRRDGDGLEFMHDKDLIFFRSTVYLNLLENVLQKTDKVELICLVPTEEIRKLLDDIDYLGSKLIYSDDINLSVLLNAELTKYLKSYKYNLILFADIINLRPSDIEQCFNLLTVDANSLVASKSYDGIIQLLGFKQYNKDLINHLIDSSNIMDKFLSYSKSCDYLVNILKDVMVVNNNQDFKKLYFELSQKSSLEYCSEKMHERFTHLFIEYKELLK